MPFAAAWASFVISVTDTMIEYLLVVIVFFLLVIEKAGAVFRLQVIISCISLKRLKLSRNECCLSLVNALGHTL
ncbi:hypothetical protein HMPREF3104_11880 [Corynebacterium sp. HMSC30G07]|nr:hypothetical protein HMPREF3104_11880 [Corynebacterium sp. HMSC30G07]